MKKANVPNPVSWLNNIFDDATTKLECLGEIPSSECNVTSETLEKELILLFQCEPDLIQKSYDLQLHVTNPENYTAAAQYVSNLICNFLKWEADCNNMDENNQCHAIDYPNYQKTVLELARIQRDIPEITDIITQAVPMAPTSINEQDHKEWKDCLSAFKLWTKHSFQAFQRTDDEYAKRETELEQMSFARGRLLTSVKQLEEHLNTIKPEHNRIINDKECEIHGLQTRVNQVKNETEQVLETYHHDLECRRNESTNVYKKTEAHLLEMIDACTNEYKNQVNNNTDKEYVEHRRRAKREDKLKELIKTYDATMMHHDEKLRRLQTKYDREQAELNELRDYISTIDTKRKEEFDLLCKAEAHAKAVYQQKQNENHSASLLQQIYDSYMIIQGMKKAPKRRKKTRKKRR